jgi:N-acetyl-anhydromuramyl-L-alanine amidase AmpD
MRRRWCGCLGLVFSLVSFVTCAGVYGQSIPDYAAAKWVPALSYDTGRSVKNVRYTVQYIIIHATGGERTSGTVEEFKASAKASAHYIIANGIGYPQTEKYKEGQVIQMVHDADTAYAIAIWPVGKPAAEHTGTINNSNSISIELAGLPGDSGWCTAKMYESAANLVAFLADKYGVPLTRTHILGHDEVARMCTPPYYSKSDPCGSTSGQCTFDWDHFMLLVTQAATSTSQSSTPSQISRGLVAWYPFDGNFNDQSGNGNNGVPSGSVSFTQGRIGQAVKFPGFPMGSGSSPAYVLVPNSASLALSDQFTFSFFVRVDNAYGMSGYGGDSGESGGAQCVFAKRGDRQGLWCNVLIKNNVDLMAQFGINSYTEFPGVGMILASSAYPLGTWRHLAFVYSSGHIVEYIDGSEAASESYHASDLSTANGEPLYIGIQNNGSLWYPLNGAIDDLRIYNRALSADEVRSLANAVSLSSSPSPGPSAAVAPTPSPTTTGTGGSTPQWVWPTVVGGILAIALALLLLRALGAP